MKIFPAIDIKDKKCVRLVKGDFDNKTEYKMSPVEQAGKYKDHGFKNLHIVDLDGALTGETVNLNIIHDIVSKFDLKVEIGGGIRNIESIKKYIEIGADKVILGSAAIKNRNFLKAACEKFSNKIDLDNIAKEININDPKLLQSMYIFKQPRIGGEVVCHQDSTFLYTKPETAVGFWVALEDANIDNGCLWVASRAHKGPLRNLFTKKNNKMTMISLNDTPFEKTDTPVEVKKGTLVLLHGRLPHYSCENKSNKSRHAYTFHVIDGNADYPKENWLQRPNLPLRGFI